jgi:restriction system protein
MDEYVGIVLASSVYPESFEVSYDHSFDASDRELRVTVLAPHPDAFPTTKAFRYNKTTDEITATTLPAAEVKRRYASAIAQTALRTAHEVFEADREEIIDSIALTVAVDTVDAATGHDTRIDLVRLATDRADFLPIDLARVEPTATLAHLAAAVSKNPYGLVPMANHGVRG